MQPEIANYLKGHFLAEELRDWDVSRPAPYFGFEIPDAPGHYWYVWFDAPIGYMASTARVVREHGESFDDWWRSDKTEIHHFIGKDIVYFHTLFWPAMLKAAGFPLPKRVQVHGLLTVNGEKMSQVARARSCMASTYLKHLDPAYLRYYYAQARLAVDDLDLNVEEFVAKVNSDLVGKVVNLASRTARFVQDTGSPRAIPMTEACSASGRRGRRNRGRLRDLRLCARHAHHHGAGRSRERIRRSRRAVGAEEAAGKGRQSCATSAPSPSTCTGN